MKPNEIVNIVLIVLEVLASIALIVTVLFQSGKESGMEALSGKNESYLGKGKAGSLDKILASWTKWIALVWAALALALCCLL